MNQQPRPHQTDDTVLDLPAHETDVDPTGVLPATDPAIDPANQPMTGGATSGRTRRRLLVGGAALVVAAALTAGFVLGGGSSSSPAAAEDRPATGIDVAVTPTTAPAPETPAPPDSPAAEEPQPDPGVLALDTSSIVLPDGEYEASFVVRNDGGSPIDWTFAGGFAVGVSEWGGTLEPGASTVVSVSVNPFQLVDGPFAILNHVVAGDQSLGLAVHGVKTPIVLNPDIPHLDVPLKK